MNASRFVGLTPVKITVAYVVAGAVWIAFSDRLLIALFSDGPLFDAVMTGKGWLFVAVSGAVLYAMLSYRERALRETRTELEQSRTTIREGRRSVSRCPPRPTRTGGDHRPVRVSVTSG